MKRFFSTRNHSIKSTEIRPCGLSFGTAQDFDGRREPCIPKAPTGAYAGLLKAVDIGPVVPHCSAHHAACVTKLRKDYRTCDLNAGRSVVRSSVLLSPEEYIPVCESNNTTKKPSPFGEKGDRDASLRAEAHERGARANVTKADNSVEVMDRDPHRDLPVSAHNDGFTFLREVAALGRYEESIEVTFHTAPALSS